MSLRELAESDLAGIVEDATTGFGWPVTVTAPNGFGAVLTGLSNDISQVIDPDTGQIVSGRLATVVLRTSSLDGAGLGQPVGVSDAESKPWIIGFDDINGTSYKFKVRESNPDRALGLVFCILEAYE